MGVMEGSEMKGLDVHKTVRLEQGVARQRSKKPKARFVFLKAVLGAFLFHCMPRKQVVFIASSMRSGSTLLKALLGQGEDVSHLSESYFSRIDLPEPLLRYYQYFDVYRKCRSKIIVLKTPAWFQNYSNYPRLPDFPVKLIILVRHPSGVLASLKEWTHIIEGDFGPKTEDDYKQYIFNVNKALARAYFERGADSVLLVSYEELISRPIEVTKSLFQFVGSVQKEGVDTYTQGDALWEWGVDDGSPTIKKGQVVSRNVQEFNAQSLLISAEQCQSSEEFFSATERNFENA